MKIKLALVLVAVVFSVRGCGSTYNLRTTLQESHPWMETQHRSYAGLLSQAQGKTVQIVLSNGQEFLGTITRADADSIGWQDAKDSTVHLLPTSGVQKLEITHHYNLWWLGGLVGLLAGTVPSVAAGGWELTDKGNYSYRLAVVGGGLTGALVGGIAGNAIHHTDQYLVAIPGSPDTMKSH